MAEDSIGRPGACVHRDEQRGVASLLENAGVLRPLLLNDELATGIELLRKKRVERPPLARAVTVHDHDLIRSGCDRAADGGVDLLRVQLSTFLVEGFAGGHLLPLGDPRHSLHVTNDEDAQSRSLQKTLG
jgi:hypothetical protein